MLHFFSKKMCPTNAMTDPPLVYGGNVYYLGAYLAKSPSTNLGEPTLTWKLLLSTFKAKHSTV